MSFDDYANHIYQKYRLNVAIAILKTKPQNLTSIEYLAQLKSNMADKMAVDDDVTICSDDFMMDDDDSDNILLDIDDEIFNERNDAIRFQENGDQNNFAEDLTQATFDINSQSQRQFAIATEVIDNDVTYYENTCSQSVLKDNVIINKELINNSKDLEQNNPLKSNNSIFNNISNINKTQVEYANNNELNLTANTTYDSQKTIIYTVPNFTQNCTHYSPSQNELVIPNNYLCAIKNNNTNISNTKEGTNADNYKVTISDPNTIMENNHNRKEVTIEKTKVIDTNTNLQNENTTYVESQNENYQNANINNVLSENQLHVINKNNTMTYISNIKEVTNVENSKNINIGIQNTRTEYNNNRKENTNARTKVTDTNTIFQAEIYIPDNIVNLQNKNNQNTNTLSQNINNVSQNQNDFDNSESILKVQHVNSQLTDEYFNEIHNINKNTILNETNFETPYEIEKITQHIIEFSQNNEIQSFDFDKNRNRNAEYDTKRVKSQNVEPNYAFSQHFETIDEEIGNNFDKNLNKNTESNTNSVKSQNVEPNYAFSQHFETIDEEIGNNFDKNLNINTESNTKSVKSQNIEPNYALPQNFETIDEEIDSNEIISYKVLEELNNIKGFLRRKDRRVSADGFSSDSGYRSDSQHRSSNRSALQLSGASINQSAYCLLNYLMQCPLISATRDITQEIAQTLGQLIDKLHEEESYPPFLEEILDGVDALLRQMYTGNTNINSEFLEKDEYMQRILLLNKSIQIQKHSINKITEILTQFYQNIADKNVTYELTNIDEVESLSYIFHILEILLKKYIKNKDSETQINSQCSQENDKILNKSAITDIWRQKWNPNLKKDNEGSRENRCVLKKCSEILNKIVVDCVDSYSLVAFSALKCFNSLQN